MFPRIREITDAFGTRLRVSVEEHPGGALVVLESPDLPARPRAMLDGYGADVLAGYIMSARLSVPHGLPDEDVDGLFAARFSLATDPAAAIAIARRDAPAFEVAAPFWDRLFAELTLIGAHAREMGRRAETRVH